MKDVGSRASTPATGGGPASGHAPPASPASSDPLFTQLEQEEETFISEMDEKEKEAEILSELMREAPKE